MIGVDVPAVIPHTGMVAKQPDHRYLTPSCSLRTQIRLLLRGQLSASIGGLCLEF